MCHTNQIGNFCKVNHGINIIIALYKCQSLLLACKITKQIPHAKILNFKILSITGHKLPLNAVVN